MLEALAGLLAAGLLVVGVTLAALLVIAPLALHGVGPRPDRVIVALTAGAIGEAVFLGRGRLPVRARPAVAGGVVLTVLAALWWGWWR